MDDVFEAARLLPKSRIMASHGPYALTAGDMISISGQNWLTDQVFIIFVQLNDKMLYDLVKWIRSPHYAIVYKNKATYVSIIAQS